MSLKLLQKAGKSIRGHVFYDACYDLLTLIADSPLVESGVNLDATVSKVSPASEAFGRARQCLSDCP